MFKHNSGYKVLTDSGFQDFAGIDLIGIRPVIRIELTNDLWIECTTDHKIYTSASDKVEAKNLVIGDTVLALPTPVRVTNIIDLQRSEPVYDLIEVDGGHRYYTNKILSSNCEFVSFEETLINSILLSTMEGCNPISNMGQSRWYKELSKDSMYAISLDPSLGTGGDNAAIQVFELPSFEQVAEWSHNLTPIQGQIKILREILNYILLNIGNENINNIYWSIENNTIGEAGLVCIQDIGEDKLPGLFLCEPAKKGMVKKTRKGFNTTHRTKVNAAARLKYLIESGKMKIHSKLLISELKNYVSSGVSFKAKTGQTDDLVAALLLIIRMSHVLSDWDATVFDSFSSSDEDNDESFSYPMPIYISSY